MKVQRYARGLLDLFDSRGVGKTPQDTSEHVQLTTDVDDFYLTSLLKCVVDQSAPVAGVYSKIQTVPQGVVWRVRAASVSLTPAAAAPVGTPIAVIAVSPLAAGGGAIPVTVASVNYPAPTFPAALAAVAKWDRPLVLPPGGFVSFAVNVRDAAIVAPNATSVLLVEELVA